MPEPELPGAWRTRAAALAPLGITLVILALYWFLYVLPVNQGYATNPASLNYRGPDRLWDGIVSYEPAAVMMIAGIGFAAALALREFRIRTVGPGVIMLAWLGVVWGLLGISILMGTATDYPRFTTILLAPLVVGCAGAFGWAGQISGVLLSRLIPEAEKLHVSLLVAGLLLMLQAPSALGIYYKAAAFYQMDDVHSLEVAAEWIDSTIPTGQNVLAAQAREGKWVEALTGRAALFSMPVRYSFREAEWERSIAADTIIKGTYAMTSPAFFVKYYENKTAGQIDVPRQQWIAANHDGEYLDMLRIKPTDVKVFGADGVLLATMNSLDPVSWAPTQTEGLAQGQSLWGSNRPGGWLALQETTEVSATSNQLRIVYQVETAAPISGLSALLSPAPGIKIAEATNQAPNEVEVTFPRSGSRQPSLRIRAEGQGSRILLTDEGLLVSSAGSEVSVIVTNLTAGAPIAGVSLLNPHQLLEDYQIGAVLLPRSDSLPARVERLEALGLREGREIGPYVVMMRDYYMAEQ